MRRCFKKSHEERYELSSKSVKRFLVNFHMKKATTPMTATPPATDKPIIEPVLRPESEEGGRVSGGAVELGEAELVWVTTTSELIVIRPWTDEGRSEVVVRGGKDEEEVVDVGLDVSEEAELTTVLEDELRLVRVPLLVVLVGVDVTEDGGSGRISLWAATKYEKRRERKTDDHFIFVGRGDSGRDGQFTVTWSRSHMQSHALPPPHDQRLLMSSASLDRHTRTQLKVHVYRMSLSLQAAPPTDS